VLQGRLNLLAAGVAVSLVATACASVDGTERGVLREEVIEPGLEAIEEADALACSGDAATLRTALESFALLEGGPALDEAALVAEGYLREQSELWDVSDGVLVPADPGCGEVPDVETVDIVTEDEAATAGEVDDLEAEIAAMTPDDILADATPEEIAEVGGPDCAYEVAVVGLAFARWTFDQQAEPSSLSQLVDDGYLEPPDLWTLDDAALVPNDGSSCVGPLQMFEQDADACTVEYRTLVTAIEAYQAQSGASVAPPSEADLVAAELLRAPSDRYDVVNGKILPAPGSTCDVGVGSEPIGASPGTCDTERRILETAIEAFAARTGRLPDNEQELLDAEIIGASFESYDVVYGEIVPGDGSPCE
jgi:hypothetical protein